MLYFFISHKSKRISFKFFETTNEMREFINRGYKFSNYDDQQKFEFLQYLIKISECVMINSKLKTYNIKVDREIQK